MLRQNLHLVYFYEKVITKTDGESTVQWKYKNKYYLNDQQDINDLDKSESGIVDFEKMKLRTDDKLDINKQDGVSFIELRTKETGIVDLGKPQYEVTSITQIGKSYLYNCSTYNGE